MRDLSALCLLAALEEHGNLGRAADELGMSKGNASKQLTALERRANVELIRRSGPRLELSADAQTLLPQAQQLLQAWRIAKQQLGALEQAPTGRLLMLVPRGLGQRHVAPLMPDFLARYPEVTVELQLQPREISQLDWRVDLALVVGEQEDSSRIARRLGEIHSVVCAAPGYLERYGVPQTPHELLQHHCVLTTYPRVAAEHWRFKLPMGTIPLTVNSRLYIDDNDAVLGSTLAGGGITLQPLYAVQKELEQGALVPLLLDYQIPSVPLYAVYNRRERLPGKLSAMLDFLQERLHLPSPLQAID